MDRCEKCGTPENLVIHHVDHDAYNNKKTNLQVLCQPCHGLYHAKVKSLITEATRGFCQVEDCAKQAANSAQKFCAGHLRRQLKYGDPCAAIPIGALPLQVWRYAKAANLTTKPVSARLSGMSIIQTLSWLWKHKPTSGQMQAVQAIGDAAKQLIATIEANLPDAEGRKAAVALVNDAAISAHLALAGKAASETADPESSTLAP